MTRLVRRTRGEQGISTVIVAVSLVGILGAAVLAIDAGGLYATRRRLVTATDAAVLAAARLYATGLADPCLNKVGGENEATIVLNANEPNAEHNGTATPDGYHVTTPPRGCKTGNVRYDARLKATQSFSGIFGFGSISPFASSTAEFGYVIIMAAGLRPLSICDQTAQSYPGMNTAPGQGPPYAHFALWDALHGGRAETISQSEYDNYWGSLETDYPKLSIVNTQNLAQSGRPYLPPSSGGHGVVHRIDVKDSCVGGVRPPPWRGWVDLNGPSSDNLETWLKKGFDGPISLGDLSSSPPIPKDCNASSGPFCQVVTQSNLPAYGTIRDSLNTITCPAATASKDCLRFPILVDRQVTSGGNARVHQTAFVFVVLRGWGSVNPLDLTPCNGLQGCSMDFEFVDTLGVGTIGSNPSSDENITTPRGISLCGVDHDSKANRCHV